MRPEAEELWRIPFWVPKVQGVKPNLSGKRTERKNQAAADAEPAIIRSCSKGQLFFCGVGRKQRKGWRNMENFIAKVEAVNGAVNSFAWGPLMLLLLVGTGVS